ncbi:MAG TPA: type II toxin-antitoxin system PemK/MazF family toxin [Gracilimonas sp.]|uniref:type II toxin-antitoxin system PemK/MazF family toxin n=1 Tax=Gracilimonas sp. TaxID=1974203 RepID=UPI002DA71F2F|nr:type II toxin-antitoxin system PemK/MazF family toxin [Gracilimonas sp.]
MTYNQWDIVLLPFPFTNLKTNKKRPALIISPKEYNLGLDILVMFVTSNINAEDRVGDYELIEWKEAGLPKPSMTRMKFATIDKNLVVKKIAALREVDIIQLKKEIKTFLGL